MRQDPAFVDTSVWYAAADSGDAHNEVARSLLSAHGPAVVTSDLVLAELWNLVCARANYRIAHRVTGAVMAGGARIECVEASDLAVAEAVASTYEDQAFSLTDRTSWALMERLGINQALAFDSDFRIYRYGHNRRKAFTVHP